MNALSLLSFKSGGKIELNRIEIFRLPRMLFYSVLKICTIEPRKL